MAKQVWRRLRTGELERGLWKCSLAAAVLLLWMMTAAAADKQAAPKKTPSGEEIFRREWLADDPRSHGGDGLGPVFNESSCVACHNQGGVGGGGPLEKNVALVTAFLPTLEQLKTPDPAQATAKVFKNTGVRAPGGAAVGVPASTPEPAVEQVDEAQRLKQIEQQHAAAQEALFKLHPGFRDSRTVVLHRFGTDAQHEDWRNSLNQIHQTARTVNFSFFTGDVPQSSPFGVLNQPQAPSGVGRARLAGSGRLPMSRMRVASAGSEAPASVVEQFPAIDRIRHQIQSLQQQARSDLASASAFGSGGALQMSQRNTTALFGAGLIDAIPAAAIEAAAAKKHDEFADVTGRVHHLKDGRIGRFGWKAQEASLYDFTMTACAVEVGLHVPDHPQSPVPYKPEVEPAGYDLDQSEANALVDYLRQLPAPVQRKGSHAEVAALLDEGEKLFESVGCAACHVKQMGEVDGLFSDLLLHDMGPDLGAVGSYGVPTPSPDDPGDLPLADADGKPRHVEPTAQEWRTPPLWGVRDSAPYLHDGRAATLEQAIAFHGGEAAEARLRFFMQPQERRQKIIAFLKSLTAPD